MRARADRASVPRMKSILGQSPQPNQAVGFTRRCPVAKSPFSRRGAHTPLAVGLLAGTLLTGCSSTPAPTPTPTALIAGKFATEEEALAAARTVYLTYSAFSEQLSEFPASDSEALRTITSSELYQYELDSASVLRRANVTVRGGIVYSNFLFDESTDDSVSFLMCADVSGSRIIASDGKDITDDSDNPLVSMRATVVFSDVSPIVETVDGSEISTCGD